MGVSGLLENSALLQGGVGYGRVIALRTGGRKPRGYAVSADLWAEDGRCGIRHRPGAFLFGMVGVCLALEAKGGTNLIILLEKSAQTGNRRGLD
jgi:hypothetical protein